MSLIRQCCARGVGDGGPLRPCLASANDPDGTPLWDNEVRFMLACDMLAIQIHTILHQAGSFLESGIEVEDRNQD